MKITVWSLTFNDDNAMPYCEVYASEEDAIDALFDYLEIPDDDRLTLRRQWHEDGEFNEELFNRFKKNDYDSYGIASHDLRLTSEP